MSTRSLGTRALGPIAALVIVLAACSSGPAVSSAPIVSVSPSAAIPTTATTTASAPSISTAAQVIPEGSYATAAISVADIISRINASNLSAAEKKDDSAGFSGKAVVYSLDFQAGKFVQRAAVDGGASEVGTRGTYAFPDDHTLLIQEQCCGVTTFRVTSEPLGFRLMALTGAATDLISKIVYESAPFTLVP